MCGDLAVVSERYRTDCHTVRKKSHAGRIVGLHLCVLVLVDENPRINAT
jgi:hypothetical protein